MDTRTKDLFDELNRVEWFGCVDEPLPTSADIVPVSGWEEALRISSTQESRDARLEGRNELTVQLSIHHDKVARHWNSLVDEFEPIVSELVGTRMATSAIMARLPAEAVEALLPKLRRDFLLLCMAREHEYLVRTKYLGLVEHWYLAGRFPCGWIGYVPDDLENAFDVGKLAVL